VPRDHQREKINNRYSRVVELQARKGTAEKARIAKIRSKQHDPALEAEKTPSGKRSTSWGNTFSHFDRGRKFFPSHDFVASSILIPLRPESCRDLPLPAECHGRSEHGQTITITRWIRSSASSSIGARKWPPSRGKPGLPSEGSAPSQDFPRPVRIVKRQPQFTRPLRHGLPHPNRKLVFPQNRGFCKPSHLRTFMRNVKKKRANSKKKSQP